MASPSRLDVVFSFTGVCLLNLIAAIESTSLSVSLPTIADALRASSVQAYWAGSSFLLASAVAQPIYAVFSKAFSRRTLTLVALTLFTIGTIVCGSAQNVASLLVGRVFQGSGVGGFLTMTYAILVDLFALRQRTNAMAAIGIVWLVGTVVGPIMGGGFAEHVTWRWIFWICLPFAGISIFLVAFFLKTPHTTLNTVEALKKVDWLGAGLFTACLTVFLVAISWGGNLYAWSSYETLVPLVVGAVGLIGWIVYERYIPAAPMTPMVLFTNRTNIAVFPSILFFGIIQYGQIYYLPLYYQTSKNYTILVSGVALLPQCLLSGPTTMVTSILISKTGQYRLIIWIGWVLLSLGCGLLVLLNEDTTPAQWIFINAVSGIASGFLFTSQSVATQAASEQQHMVVAAGLAPFFRTIGQCLGVVIGNTIFQNRLRLVLGASTDATLRRTASVLADDYSRIVSLLRDLPSDSPERRDVLNALNVSFHAIWWTLTALALMSLLLSLCIPQLSIDAAKPPQRQGEAKISSQETEGEANTLQDVEGEAKISPDTEGGYGTPEDVRRESCVPAVERSGGITSKEEEGL